MTRFNSRAVWSGAVLTLACASLAHAQTPAPESELELEEIIVTATRVSESLQKTALAIQAVTSEDITRQGAVSPEEIGKLVPSMTITSYGTTTIYLRGLGANGAGGFAQNSIAFSVDGVVLAQQPALGGNFFDLERVEVLKGPQGTLYGRNASAGAINVISRNPGRELGGDLNVEVGNYNLSRVSGALNVPLSDTFALRGAVYSSEREGYNDDGTDDEDQLNGRLKALWTPNEDVRVLLGFSVSDVSTRAANIIGVPTPRPPVNGDPRLGPTDPAVAAVLASVGAPTPNPNMHTNLKNQLAYATVDWNLGFGTLTYIPAYGWGKQCIGCEGSIIPFPAQDLLGTHIKNDQLSNELRLAHVGDRFKYVAGLYQIAEHTEMENLYFLSSARGAAFQNVPTLDTDSYAAFGEATFSLTDAFRVIGGLRYTRDEKELEGTGLSTGSIATCPAPDPAFLPVFVPAVPCPLPGYSVGTDPIFGSSVPPTTLRAYSMNNSGDFSRTNWKVGAEYDVSPTSFLFATVGTGYKSGIFYPGPGPGNLADPEYMTAYTIGSKNRFLDNSLQVNAEAFYWKFKNQQISSVGVDAGGSLNQVTYNAGASTLYGANIDVVWRLTPRDMFRTTVEYNHPYYDEFKISSPLASSFGSNALGGGCARSEQPGGLFGTTYFADCSGKHMAFAPDWSGNAAYGHDFTVGAGNTLHAEVSARANSQQYVQLDWSSELSRMPGYVTLDAILEYSFADKPWTVALWGRNLNDKTVYTSADSANIPGIFQAGLQAPRTFGLRFNMNF